MNVMHDHVRRSSVQRRRSVTRLGWAPLLSWALGLFLLGCGKDLPPAPPGAGLVLRVPLQAEGTIEQESQVVVARHIPKRKDRVKPSDPVIWEGIATKSTRFTKIPRDTKPESKKPENRIPAYLVDGTGRMAITLKGEFDPKTFNQAVVVAAAYSTEPVYVTLIMARKGKDLVRTPAFELLSIPAGPKPMPFALQENRSHQAAFDELRIEFEPRAKKKDRTEVVAVSEVMLLKQPSRAFLPQDEGGEVMVTLGDEARRGPVLDSRVPLYARMTVPAGSRLRFSYALIEGLRAAGQKPVLNLSVKGSAGELQRSYPLEAKLRTKARWRSASIPFDESLGSGDVEIRFALEAQTEIEAYAVIGEPIVSKRGENPSTVLLITSDTHRSDHVGYAGGPVKTPTLDALGARGVTYSQAYTSTNITNPSHIALMTALGPRDTRIINNNTPLAADAETLAERFRAAGYRTFASASAFHLAHDESGLGQGFDRLNAPHRHTRLGGASVNILDDWVEEADGEPLFVWLHVFDAHAPYVPPPPYDRRYYPKDKDPYAEESGDGPPLKGVPPVLANLKDTEFAYQQYRAAVDYVDATVGRVTDQPRFAKGIIAFTADHGESFGHHKVWWDHAELYPGSTHVPLLLAWPGAPAGTQVSMSVQQIDVGRTILDLAGLEEAEFPGRNLALAAEDALDPEPIYGLAAHRMSAFLHLEGYHMILHIRFHHEWSLEAPRQPHELELYNVREDPECKTNLVDEDPKRTAQMRAALVKWLASAPTQSMGRSKNMTKDQAAQLKSLGYTGGESEEEALIDPECACDYCAPFR